MRMHYRYNVNGDAPVDIDSLYERRVVNFAHAGLSLCLSRGRDKARVYLVLMTKWVLNAFSFQKHNTINTITVIIIWNQFNIFKLLNLVICFNIIMKMKRLHCLKPRSSISSVLIIQYIAEIKTYE